MNSPKISVAKKIENGSVVKKMKAVEKMKNQEEKEQSGNSDRSLSLCLTFHKRPAQLPKSHETPRESYRH